MSEIGEYMRFRIQKRTAEGEDVDGKAFEPYSPAYAAARSAAGHPANVVNLFFTGSMMSSMDFEISRDKVDLFFTNSTDPTGTRNPLKAYFLNQKRTFFALSEEDIQGVVDLVNRYYNRVIRQ